MCPMDWVYKLTGFFKTLVIKVFVVTYHDTCHLPIHSHNCFKEDTIKYLVIHNVKIDEYIACKNLSKNKYYRDE